MKLKHNKKRNTAFLFEVLTRELTKSCIRKDVENKKKIISIIKEHFNNGSILKKELELYKSLHTDQNLKPHIAEKLIYETRAQYKKINKEIIFQEQSKLINEINKTLSKEIFTNFVPNYKNMATIYQIFNDELLPKKKVLLEDVIRDWLVNVVADDKKENNFPKINNLIMKKFVVNFNERYRSFLLPEQKQLLQKYIFSFANNGVELKLFLNEELGRLKKVVIKSLKMKEVKNDPEMKKKSKEVLELLESFKEKMISNIMIEKIIKIQHLASEIKD